MEYKVWYNYFLFKLGIRKILPRKIISNVKIKDSGEELVLIDESNFIVGNDIEHPLYLRKTVYEKICKFNELANKDGYKIKLLDTYRSLESQKRSWEKRILETKKLYPDASEEDIVRLTSLKVANPTNGNGGHQTGGAIDITLTDKNGVELDMGSKYAEHIPQTKTYSKELTEEQYKNRQYLLDNMKKLDFVNFPTEWWHYCYGDQMWAAYKGKKECFYGYIEPVNGEKKNAVRSRKK